jgi:hypothetical protein
VDVRGFQVHPSIVPIPRRRPPLAG